jgi:hypothetical protein
MRRARHLLWVLALAAAPANATSVTVQISGTWSAIGGKTSVLDGSVVSGDSFLATLIYDDAVPDVDPSPGLGAYFTPAANSDLSIVTGNYTFTPGSSVGVGVENNNVFGEDWIRLHASSYTATGPFPVGVGVGPTAYSDSSLTDFSGTALTSDALIGLNWTLGDYDTSDVYLFIEITGFPTQQFVDFAGTITGITVLPEPSMVMLAAVAGTALALSRRRG